MRRLLLNLVCLCGLSLWLTGPLGAAPTTGATTGPTTAPTTAPVAKRTPFTAIVARHFDRWDVNDDDILSNDEIDRLVLDATITGEDAAAIAAMKIVQRSGKFTIPSINLEYFVEYERQTAARKKPSPNWDGYFRSSKRRIALGKKAELHWPASGLSLKNMRQGPLGDCYLVAVVGAMVERDPEQLHAMVTPLPDRRFQIAFPATQPIIVGPLTDAQIAISSTTAGDGVWLALFEQAYGRLRASIAGKHEVVEATDLIARGGSTSHTIAALTGKGRQVVYFPRNRDRDTEKHITRIRNEIVKGLTARKIVTASVAALPTTATMVATSSTASLTTRPTTQTSDVADAPSTQPTMLATSQPATRPAGSPRVVPPGIDTKHAYAILSYDADTDMIELWNPHGQTFKPRGEPGLTRGYPTANGRFRVPVREAYRFLSLITIESDSPATQPATQPAMRPATRPATHPNESRASQPARADSRTIEG